MTEKEKQRSRLESWQERFRASLLAYSPVLEEMDRRERLYRGSDLVEPMFDGDRQERTPLVRNVIAENIESAINASIPYPKVSAVREEDAELAEMIEDMLLWELGRMNAEELNDMDERICPVHGASFFNVEWDGALGRAVVSQLSPKAVIPQDGVTGSVEEMEYYFLRIPQTRGYIRRNWGVELEDETEQYPDVRGEGCTRADDLVTQIFAYYKNDRGGVGVISWVGDTLIFEDDDYTARKTLACPKCERALPAGGKCPECGAAAVSKSTGWESVYVPIEVGDEVISPEYTGTAGLDSSDADGELPDEPVKIPVYRVGSYSLVERKNISVLGQFLGESDVDKMATQQNVLNRLSAKMLKKSLGGGTVLSLPDDADITVEDTEGGDLRIIRPRDAASASLIRTFTLEGDISQDMALYREAYEEARQQTGVTDSLQGRADDTAASGVAKRFAAAQSEGRFESKRIMKKAAWAKIYELIFRLNLAFSDGDRPTPVKGTGGDVRWGRFDRLAFLERGEDGEMCWCDRFIFSCDDDAPMSSERASMWREAADNLARGAYGDPRSDEALLLYWSVLESYHYPSAGMVRETLERQKHEKESAKRRDFTREEVKV